MDPPPAKKVREDGAYIPDGATNGDSVITSLIFSLKQQKGALARALRPFEVHVYTHVFFFLQRPVLYILPFHACHIGSWSEPQPY